MSAEPNEIVTLCLSTKDNVLADDFATGLEKQGLDNTVHRVTSGAEIFEFIETQPGTRPYLVLLDIRPPNTDARAFLDDVAIRLENTPPVVVVIADRDDEMAIVANFKNMVAGRISSIDPAEDFVRLVDGALASNWSLESVSPSAPKPQDD